MALEAIDLADPSGKGGLEQSQVALFRSFLSRERRVGFMPTTSHVLFHFGGLWIS